MALCRAVGSRSLWNYKTIICAAAALTISPFSVKASLSCSKEKGCNDEVENAIKADEAIKKYTESGIGHFDTIFDKILRKEVKADIVYEDEKVVH